jgi:striatin 1/3/4
VWSLASTSNGERMLSASADGSLRLWNLDGSIKEKENDALCLGRIAAETSAVPTSVDFVATDAARAVYGAVGGGGAAIVLVDVERMTNVSAIRFPSSSATTQDSMHIYQIASHPAEPTVVSAHEDGHLRLCDTRSGRCELEILAHRDAASCLAIDPKGRFVVSGSHDGSVRVWSLGERKMVQDIPDAHLKHFDTGVGAVAFSPDGTQVMTGGGDGVVNAYAQSVGAY